MQRSILGLKGVLTLWVLGIFFFGCAGTSERPTRFYVLNPLDAASGSLGDRVPEKPLALDVASLRLPQYLERPQIVTRSSKNRLELAEFHQWGGNLRKNMARVLAKNLSQLLATPDVTIAPNRPSSAIDIRIDLEVMHFERDAGGRVQLSVQWRIAQGKNRRPLVTRMTELSSPPVPDGPDYEETVSAMSTLMGELSREIAQAILEHLQ